MHSKNQRRHGSPCPSRAPLVPMKPKVSVAPSPGDTLAFRVPREYPHSRFTKAPLAVYPPKGARGKTCLSLPVVSLEKMPCLGRAEGAAHLRVNCSSSIPSSSSPSPSSLKPSLTPPAPHRPQEKLLNGRAPATPRSTNTASASPSPSSLDRRPSPARSPLDKRPSSTPSPSPLDRRPSPLPSPSLRPGASPLSPLDRKHQNGTKGSKPHRRLSGRVFDPNKHCGVQDPESKRPCTRSLTCKTHSLTHRRAVPGRRKQFDILLAEHKSRAKEKDGGKEKEGGPSKKESQGGSQTTPSQDTTTPSMPTHCHNGRTVSTLKLRLANAHIPRVPGGGGPAALSSGPALPPASTSASGSDATPSWVRVAADSRLSSDEGDGETAEDPDRPACHYSPRHPRPLGCCAFSSRLMGRGHYVFDRRWDRMRLALHCMVEQHVNAQMWRKVPLAADSFLSSPGTPTTTQPPGSTPHSLSSSPSVLTPPLLSSPSSFPPSSEGFSLVSYTAAFPQSGAGLFSFRDPPQPLAPVSALGKPRNGTNGTTKPSRPPREDSGGAKRRKTIPSLDTPKRNGNGSYPPATPLLSPGFPSLPGKKKSSLGRGGIGGPGIRGEDWFSSPDPITPYPHTRDPPLPPPLSPLPPPSSPLPPPYSPLAYGGGAEGRKRRSPSSYGGKPSKMTKAAAGLESIFRRSSTGLLSSGPESPRQPKLHH